MSAKRSRQKRRIQHHVALAATVLVTLAAVEVTSPKVSAFSMTTAYLALLLYAASFSLGPLNVIRRRPNPVSTDLRRDIGIWIGITAVLHVLFGWRVHMKYWWEYLLRSSEHVHGWRLRLDAFGLTNWIGVVATLMLVLLVLISNDAALRRLRTSRWKQLQRSSYIAALLIVAHGVLYQMIEKRDARLVLTGAIICFGAAVIQTRGRRAHLRNASHRSSAANVSVPE